MDNLEYTQRAHKEVCIPNKMEHVQIYVYGIYRALQTVSSNVGSRSKSKKSNPNSYENEIEWNFIFMFCSKLVINVLFSAYFDGFRRVSSICTNT